MKRIFVVSVMLCALSATAALAQERGNLATPYRFRLPFLDGGEYVVSAFGGTTVRTYTEQYLVPSFNQATMETTQTEQEENTPWFDVNAVVALSSKFLLGAEVTVYPGRSQSLTFFDESATHVSREFTVVYRPVERFEVFAYYYQNTPQWSGRGGSGTLEYEVDTKDVRAGVTYFGKF